MSIERTMITDHYADHVAQCQQRWSLALNEENFDAAVIHAGSEIISFLDDYHYPFRPNPHFLQWLPLTRHHDSVLIIRPGSRPKLIYFQPDDYWYLPPSDPASWWADQFDIVIARDPQEWSAVHIEGRVAYIGDAPSLPGSDGDNRNPDRLINLMHLYRTIKTDYEIACLAESNRVAAYAHTAAERAFREGLSEYHIHQAYLNAASHSDAQLPYGNIVALNEHGAVLHYQSHEHQAPAKVRSFLIDAGATQQGYCSDITRTYANHDGEFADLIVAMDELQQNLCEGMRAGVDYRDQHLKAHLDIASILHQANIILQAPEDAVESGLSSVFFPHGLGHYLGIQTHDVAGLIADADGTPLDRPEGHPFLRLTRMLEAGNVLTVEPGFYFIDSLLQAWTDAHGTADINWRKVDALKPYGGIRIEDDVVVTQGQPRNLSREAFALLS